LTVKGPVLDYKTMNVGIEWLVEAERCSPERLSDLNAIKRVFDSIIADLDLRVVGAPAWHQFPEPGGVTGLALLTESHLACHTYPESGVATFNLYCCRMRPEWPWKDRLVEMLGATRVTVRSIVRGLTEVHHEEAAAADSSSREVRR
jgi:S-adenosylmethionine decarboxylase